MIEFQDWEKRPDTIGVAVYDSAAMTPETWTGPGQLVQKRDGIYLEIPVGGTTVESYGPLVDGDYLTMRRGKLGYQAKDRLEAAYRPLAQQVVPDRTAPDTEPVRTV